QYRPWHFQAIRIQVWCKTKHIPVGGANQAATPALFSPSRLTALSLRMSGRTSSLIGKPLNAVNHFVGGISGYSVPNKTLCFSMLLDGRTNASGKYFGDQPAKSI